MTRDAFTTALAEVDADRSCGKRANYKLSSLIIMCPHRRRNLHFNLHPTVVEIGKVTGIAYCFTCFKFIAAVSYSVSWIEVTKPSEI